ncbi:cation:proton antiporter [Halorussus sp. MSC15.2]|uniref:cation:proton antiporter domain-containing protein n=1 Tax=Halorussus sp. MSC15.2 TaxID=2283638 RepID=UPI0013D19DF3|nr:cation:proton antiporter [Halorussus sp. MSC15.2]NEU57264.1 sodium:proton antiporter [Halorussus sp. MSC15.2]
MVALYRWLFAAGVLILLLGLLQKWFEQKWYLTEPLTAVALGVALGPAGVQLLGLPPAADSPRVLTQVTRVTLAVADMGVALRLPRGYPVEHWRSLAVILGAGMVLMALVSGLLVWGLLGVSFWVAMLVGATVTSTDPIVATTIVTGPVAEKNIPARVRHFISAESGANDGAVYPLVLLPILMLTRPTGEALARWATYVVGWQVVGAVALGAALGFSAARLFQWADLADIVEDRGFVAYTLALTFAVLGAARLLSMDGILASFVAGIAYRMAPGTQQPSKEKNVQKAMTKFFVLPTFVLFGVAIPWGGWLTLGWRGVLLAVLVLLLRRPPVVVALAGGLSPLRTRKDVGFTAWFGPIGISTLFYVMFAVQRTGLRRIWPVVSLLVFASLLAHGLSATPLSRQMPPDTASDRGRDRPKGSNPRG